MRPVHFYCEGPQEVHRGESVGIRCMIMSRSPYELETYIILRGSPDYNFIHVEEYGYVVSYAPRQSGGDHHHLIWVRGQEEQEVHLPIAPKKEQGEITVNIELSTILNICRWASPCTTEWLLVMFSRYVLKPRSQTMM